MIKFKRLTIALAALLITSATAWADGTLLTTITASADFQSGSKTFDNIATVTLEGNFYGTTTWDGNGTITVTPAAGVTITSVKFISTVGNTKVEDTTAPFQAVQAYDSNLSHIRYDVDGVKGDYAVNTIEVYGTAGTPLALTEVTPGKQWQIAAMPAANVTLNVEYEPEFTATFKALTANTIQAGKATVTLTDNTQGATPQSATLDADGKLTPVYEGQTITLTAQTGYKFRSVTATKGEGAASVTTATPLTMECLTDGTIKVDMGSGTLSSGMQYAVNGGEKTKITTTTTIEGLTTGDKVQFYGVGTETQDYGDSPEVKIAGGTAQVKVYGNIMSLLDEENFATKTDLPNSNSVFYELFKGNAKLTDASGLLLPATTLANYCYNSMFYRCTSLTAAPALPAKTLAEGCYVQMFYGCKALTAAPALPATTLANYCYQSMFYSCSKLASVTCKATDISATYCLNNWLYNAGTDATSPTLYVEPTMTENTGWNNEGFTVTAITQ